MQLGVVMENSAHSVDQCQPQTLQLSVHLINLLSILRYNGFTAIQEAVVDQTSGRPLNSDCALLFGANLALEFLLSPTIELVATLSYKIHFLLHVTIKLRNSSLLLRIR